MKSNQHKSRIFRRQQIWSIVYLVSGFTVLMGITSLFGRFAQLQHRPHAYWGGYTFISAVRYRAFAQKRAIEGKRNAKLLSRLIEQRLAHGM